ncbi:MAG: long-chain fatty acid--CoA ligase [Rhodospirillales bacterium]|nr:long-chain fatty acid--CoA ligase [Rhodospirillales bacterium]
MRATIDTVQSHPNLVSLFLANAENLGDRPFLGAKSGRQWQTLSWNETADRVRRLAGGLAAAGVGAGDRVMLVSESRPEWFIADLAIMALGAITVPAYITNMPNDHLHVLSNSGAKAVIVSTAALAERVLKAALSAASPPLVIAIEPPPVDQVSVVRLASWEETLAQGANAPMPAPSMGRSDTACLIYTSGTGGAPKGVMLSHGAILHNVRGAWDVLLELGIENEIFLSFLPLSHSYEHTAGLMFPMAIGAQIYFAEGVDKLGDNMAEIRPTIMTAVPRLYEMMRGRILRGIEKTGGLKKTMFLKALELGSKAIEAPGSLGMVDRIANAALEKLVRDKVRARFGGRLKVMVSGGAPLNYEVGLFFSALGLLILQGYGQTESAPVITVNRPSKVKLRTVGPPMADTEVTIAADGEILVRGELVMQGYWNDPDSTAAALKDGWLHTGDIGEFDADNFLTITDRKKDIIVNSGGDNVSPQRVEGFLTLEPEIAQAMVYGDRRPHLVALIVPAAEFVQSWTAERSQPNDIEAVCTDPDFRKAVLAAIERVNANLSTIEKVRRFLLVPEAFSVANGMMTPTLKIRRHAIRAAWGVKLEALYE